MGIKIKDFVDVITNSSTEIFTLYDEGSVNKIKAMFDNICKMVNADYKFDDLFDVKFNIYYEAITDEINEFAEQNRSKEEYERLLQTNYRDLPKVALEIIGYENLLNIAMEKQYDDFTSSAIAGLSITPKPSAKIDKSMAETVATALSNISNIFDQQACYC